MTRRDSSTRLLCLAAGWVIVVVYLVPLLWMVSSSFKSNSEIFTLPPTAVPEDVRFSNYAEVTTVIPFWTYFGNSVMVAGLATLGTLVSCSLVAYAFSRLPGRGVKPLFFVVLATIMLPSVVTLVPQYLLFRELGWVGTYLPLIVPSWLGSGLSGAFSIFLLRQFFLTIPADQVEAARIEGAGPLRTLVQVILPQAKPALAVVAIFDFLAHWNDLITPLVYLTSPEQYTLPQGLAAFQGFYVTEWNLLMAGSTLAIVPVLVLTLAAQRLMDRGIVVNG